MPKTLKRPRQTALMLTLLAALIIIETVTVATIVLSQQLKTNEALEAHTKQLLENVVNETRENAGGFLTLAQTAVRLSRALFASGFLSPQRPDQLERYFFEQLGIVPHIDGMFFGTPDGDFLFTKRNTEHADRRYVTKTISHGREYRRVTRIWRDENFTEITRADDAADNYDPRERPWYQGATAKGGLVWTDPYIFFTSRQPGITVAAPVVTTTGKLLGVVGADVELKALSEFLASQNITSVGAAFIMHRNGEVLAYPDVVKLLRPTADERFRLARLDELDDVSAKLAGQMEQQGIVLANLNESYLQRFTVRNQSYLAEFVPFSPQQEESWIMGVYAPDEYFVGSIRSGQRQSIVLAIIISVLITTLAYFLGPRMMRPLTRLQQQASQDPLTGLLNRTSFDQLGGQLLSEAIRKQTPLCAVMVDIDQFKTVNDNYGHAVGDEILSMVSERIRGGLSRSDMLARLGGDEFVLLLPDTKVDQAITAADRIRVLISGSPITTSSISLRLTASFGVAQLSMEGEVLSELLHRSDQCLLEAKRQGRNRVVAVGTKPN